LDVERLADTVSIDGDGTRIIEGVEIFGSLARKLVDEFSC